MQAILPQQRLLEDAEQQEAMLQYIKEEDVRETVRGRLAEVRARSGEDLNVARWNALVKELDKVCLPCVLPSCHEHCMQSTTTLRVPCIISPRKNKGKHPNHR